MKKVKIIKILSRYSIIINSGTNDGIEVGQKFNIIDDEKRLLTDPDTGDILDEFSAYKAQVIVKSVKERYSICETPKYNTSPAISSAISDMFSNNVTQFAGETKQKELNVSEYDIDNIFSNYSNSIVQVGDLLEKEKNWQIRGFMV